MLIAGQHDNQPIWGVIQAQKPDLLLLLGDNVYIGKNGYEPQLPDTKASILESKYKRQLEEPHFKKLLSKVPYLAIWDNHDFGLPGRKYIPTVPENVHVYGDDVLQEHRQMARGLFNQYLKYESVAPWTKHVYCSYTVNNIKFIMLDVRSHQQDPSRSNAKLLDDSQKEWLKNEMVNSTAEINVICSGLTYSSGRGDEDGMHWNLYSSWCSEFENLVAQSSNVLFLGGNVHNNAFRPHKVNLIPDTSALTGMLRPHIPDGIIRREKIFYEIVSSGVGQNFKGPETTLLEDVWEVIGWGDDDEEDKPLADKPRNNYGIIDFTASEVIVSLYGQRRDSLHYAVINREDWTLKSYWCMKKEKL